MAVPFFPGIALRISDQDLQFNTHTNKIKCAGLGLAIFRGDPQCLHVPSDAIHPTSPWSPSWFFSWHYHINNCSHFIVFFFILCICPYHRSLISLTFSCMLFTPSSFLMSTLFTLSLSVTPLILLNILISVF